MQTFSNMRRNSAIIKNLKDYGFFLVILCYEVLRTKTIFIPPMFATLFYIYLHCVQKNDLGKIIAFVMVLFVSDVSAGMPLGVCAITFSILYVLRPQIGKLYNKYLIALANVTFIYCFVPFSVVCLNIFGDVNLNVSLAILLYYILIDYGIISIYEYFR